MRAIPAASVLVVMIISLSVGSVFGAGYAVGVPILGTSGVPALAAPSLFAGVITVLYADGSPVVLESNQVTLMLCGDITNSTTASTPPPMSTEYDNSTGCVGSPAALKQTSPGAYTYSFTPPSALAGTITIYVPSGGLADDNGRIFPSVDTSIGTYDYTPASSSSSTSSNTTVAPQPPTQVTPPPSVIRQAVNEAQPAQTAPGSQGWNSPIVEMIVVLAVLSLAGCLLIIFSGRR